MQRLREIDFNKFCPKCKYKDLKDSEEPCNTCLEVPAKDEYDATPDGFEPKDEVNYEMLHGTYTKIENASFMSLDQQRSLIFEIQNKVDESQEEFVFTILTEFANSFEPFREISISKELVIKALTTFKAEHPDEFAKLSGTTASVSFIR